MTGVKWFGCVTFAAALVGLGCPFVGAAEFGVGPESLEMPEPAATAGTITMTDDFGRNVTVRDPPQRIVSLAPAATAMLVAAGASSKLVGTIEYSGQPAFERELTKIGTADAIDMERLIALRPDVVVVWPDGNNPAQIATIERLGIPIYRQEAVTLDGIEELAAPAGAAPGTGLAADREASTLEATLAALRKEYAKESRPPTVLLEVWDRPLYTVGGKGAR